VRRFLLCLTVLAVLTAALAVAALAPPASGQALSPGCAALNNPVWDAYYTQRGAGPIQFAAGDHITMAAGPPDTFTGLLQLSVDSTQVDGTAYPGTVEYTFPAAGQHLVVWGVAGFAGTATWAVSCEAGFDPDQAITDLKDTVSGMGLPKGLTTALNAKLNAALAALDADDHASACTALQDFQNLVNAQTGKKLTQGQAEDLTDAATQIFEQICFT
jgi:FIMAH domain